MIEIKNVLVEDQSPQELTTIKVGTPIRVLIKEYGDTYKTHNGTVIGIDRFKELPTINIAYVDVGYSEAEMKFVAYNKQSKGIEIVPNNDIPIENLHKLQQSVEEQLCKNIEKKEKELREAERKLLFFQAHFKKNFVQLKEIIKD